MRVFVNKSSLAAFFVSAFALLSTSSLAQTTTEPLDLTILSTNEENVQFIVIDEKQSPAQIDDNQTKLDERAQSDNDSEQAADDELAQAAADNQSQSVQDELDTQTQTGLDQNQADAAEVTQTQTTEAQATEAQATSDQAPVTTRIERRKIKDVGLASIGIDDADDALDTLDSLLWRGVSVDKALALIQAVPISHHADSLRRASYQVIARQAVPPKGAAEDPMKLLDARMGFLARAGRSDGLAEIIRQLPDNQEWQNWKEWQIFYDLMMREDEAACKLASENVQTSLEPLWQKTNLLCQILTGNEAMASFSSDVLKASGLVDDELFFTLIDVLLGRREGSEITTTEPLSLMNMILMDAAHISISAEQMAALDQSYAKAANALRYLSDEARQIQGLSNLRSGLITSAEAKALFLSSMGNVDDTLKAMTRRVEQGGDLSSVQLYLSLHRAVAQQAQINNDNATIVDTAEMAGSELPQLIVQAFGQEIRAGEGRLWSSFYAPILAEAVSLSDMTALPSDLQKQYAILTALSEMPLSPLPVDGQVILMAGDIATILDEKAPLAQKQEALIALGLDDLLILLGGEDEADWFSLYLESEKTALSSYQALPQTGLKALSKAAADGQQAETILLATILLAQHDLAQIAPTDLAAIIGALSDANLQRTATALSAEALKAHSLAQMAAYF